MKRLILSIFTITLTTLVYGQRVVNVCGEVDYVVPEAVSLAQAKQNAIDRAKNQAIADKFGTLVSQTNITTMQNNDDCSQTSFSSYSGTDSRGVWLSNTKEPEINIKYDGEDMIIHVKVCGKARELKNANVELKVSILCNNYNSDKFKDRDKLSILLQTPVSGYVAIFLREDLSGNISCLVPYENEGGKARYVRNNKEYILLSTKDPLYPYKEETILVTERQIEYNTIIVIFSSDEFSMPLTQQGEFVPELSAPAFQKWLYRNRVHNENIQVLEKSIEIVKN